jgi:hypothetical protein
MVILWNARTFWVNSYLLVRADVTLRVNEYEVCSAGSPGHPLPREFASCESLLENRNTDLDEDREAA